MPTKIVDKLLFRQAEIEFQTIKSSCSKVMRKKYGSLW